MSHKPGTRRGCLRAAFRALRLLLLLVLCGLSFVVVSSVAGAKLSALASRLLLSASVVLVLPLLLRWWLQRRVGALGGTRRRGGSTAVLLLWNLGLLVLLCLGFSDAVGRAVRRRGDWFLGEADGVLARHYRLGITAAAAWMEQFDLPPEAQAALADAVPRRAPAGPRPSPVPPPPGPVTPPPEAVVARWVYPLGGPTRVVTRYAIQRFGAPRGGRQPAECEGGHCGIDLQQPQGTPVHAVHDGVVLKVVRQETPGRGRYLQLAHRDGEVMTVYLHLHTIRDDLRVGSAVESGSVIGTVGHSGLTRGGSHLHFELAIRDRGEYRFLDPEPIVASWPLPEASGETHRPAP